MFHKHKFKIGRFCNSKGKNSQFMRTCECGERQVLTRPKEYDPTKYVWQNEKGEEFDN